MTAGLSVPETLESYLNRGLFRDFQAGPGPGDFRFLWMGHKPVQLRWTPGERTIVFRDLLPNVPARSAMYRELRDFLKDRAAGDLPDHRRVDAAAFEILCQNRRGAVSVGLRVTGGTEEEAVHKLTLLAHEMFLMLHDRWLDYMHEEFGASLE